MPYGPQCLAASWTFFHLISGNLFQMFDKFRLSAEPGSQMVSLRTWSLFCRFCSRIRLDFQKQRPDIESECCCSALERQLQSCTPPHRSGSEYGSLFLLGSAPGERVCLQKSLQQLSGFSLSSGRRTALLLGVRVQGRPR